MRKISQAVGRITADPRAQFATILVALVISRSHPEVVQDSIVAGGLVAALAPRKD